MKICHFGGRKEENRYTIIATWTILMLYCAIAVRSFSLTALPKRPSAIAAVVSKNQKTNLPFGGRYSARPGSTTVRFLGSDSSSHNSEGGGIDPQVGGEKGVADKLDEYRNRNNINDQVFSAISHDGGVKVTVCTARNLINEVMLAHNLTPVSADALGRTMICALLMSNGIQAEQTVQLTMNSDGPIRGIVAVSTGEGATKGYVGSPMLGEMKLTEAVGLGAVQVVKNHPDWPNPYNGITAIRYGDIDRDIGAYLAESEQRSCALAAATSINGVLCTAAGGYLIEQLPGAESETMEQVQKNLAVLVEKDGGDKLPTSLLLKGVTPVEIAEIVLDGLGMDPLQQIEPTFKCKCTSDRLMRALRLLPPEEVEDILETEGKIEARCEFCGKIYRMGADEARVEMAKIKGDPAKDSDFFQS